nr:immunoglobulin light chain junction region [Macaca mulatta]MOV96434.1 immunoglobulin light chain junction region [Macaca mulatta]MOV96730.1 immunoglobulin light chain junction region [Macaca mulatta]MOV97622.1 immunoglobulin light chain junction region [Macaca mulatta]MOW00357.1 immunoglobulin light chain junction region [Macaca mulatta]
DYFCCSYRSGSTFIF